MAASLAAFAAYSSGSGPAAHPAELFLLGDLVGGGHCRVHVFAHMVCLALARALLQFVGRRLLLQLNIAFAFALLLLLLFQQPRGWLLSVTSASAIYVFRGYAFVSGRAAGARALSCGVGSRMVIAVSDVGRSWPRDATGTAKTAWSICCGARAHAGARARLLQHGRLPEPTSDPTSDATSDSTSDPRCSFRCNSH